MGSSGRMWGCRSVGQGHTLDSLGHSHPSAGHCPSGHRSIGGFVQFRFSKVFHWDHDHDKGWKHNFETTNLNTFPLFNALVNGQTSQGFKSRRKCWPILWWVGNALDSPRCHVSAEDAGPFGVPRGVGGKVQFCVCEALWLRSICVDMIVYVNI